MGVMSRAMKIMRRILLERLAMKMDAHKFDTYRPALVRALGQISHPAAVTEAWYAANCPPRLDRATLPRKVRVHWFVSRAMRGVHV